MNAHLAIPLGNLEATGDHPRFISCSSCPQRTRELPGGRDHSVTISPDALYSLSAADIELVYLYIERSVLVRGFEIHTVLVIPTETWMRQTQGIRNSYPDDTVAWLKSDRFVSLSFNVNRMQPGLFAVAGFFCRKHADQFLESMQLDFSVIMQSDAEYEASIAQMNSKLENARVQPGSDRLGEGSPSSGVPMEVLVALESNSSSTLPLEPNVLYGSEYVPLDCG